MGEKQVWEIIKNFNCADLKIVVDPAVAVWNHQQAIIDEHTEVIKLQDTDLRKYEKQIESLKAQLNNMEACYIGKKNEVDEQQSKIEQLEKRIAKTLGMLEGDLSYVEEDRRRNFDFLQMAMIRCLKDDIKTLRGAND